MPNSIFEPDIRALSAFIRQTILGKDDVIERVVICLLSQGHLLIEDVPGVGKTTLALALANSIEGTFHRIQFTSDLLPSDVLGVPIFNGENRTFEFKPGPIFANVVLADEINRTTPKTQSAMLEAMQDGRVTVEKTTHDLPRPFMVIATQNPIEFHGTYPLPESQLDRFLMRIKMGYPAQADELKILQTKASAVLSSQTACTGARILEIQRAVSEIAVQPEILKYILSIVQKTRESRDLELGVSPRGSLALHRATQARALVQGRTYVTPDDVKDLALPLLAHRVIVSGRRSASKTSSDFRSTAEMIVSDILSSIEVPV